MATNSKAVSSELGWLFVTFVAAMLFLAGCGGSSQAPIGSDPAKCDSACATGMNNPSGVTGSTGPQGPVGADGMKGDPGATGAAGATGPEGPAGAPGTPGTAGTPGAPGAAGATGAAGAAGTILAKSSTYAVQATGWVSANNSGSVTATCTNKKDIVLNGGCGFTPNGLGQLIAGSSPSDLTQDVNVLDGWLCGGYNPSSSQFFMTATVTCVRVP